MNTTRLFNIKHDLEAIYGPQLGKLLRSTVEQRGDPRAWYRFAMNGKYILVW